MSNDLAVVAAEIVALIKSLELEKARRLAMERRREAAVWEFGARQKSVHELTLAIVEAKRQRERVMRTVDDLPQAQRLFAKAQVEAICREFFDAEIAEWATRKRELSRPGR
ncbi:hypothetical protein BZM27_06545 [Paraburkholderia steynii]|uniref:Uncharacterized protein n=1 Tax=Paraburkholderia steynii TaxID=1245441 RepID=A0A4R0XG63_9BURK|nr:hypothetical protein BZM27_06545 [Paraburkholderia steynii]